VASYDAKDVVAGAWWAACCVEDLFQIEPDEVGDIKDTFFDLEEPMGARVWPTKEEALADSDIQADIALGRYSSTTASRLGLKWPVLFRYE